MERLTGAVRPYDWGDTEALAAILGHVATGRPEAEYWLGAHPGAPAIVDSTGRTLDDEIERRAVELLGPVVAERFGGLPFLVKILAAAKPLSIQAHPSLDQAKAGFAMEETLGLDRSAPDRSYRDPNHKPELICALDRFEAKCGLRPAGGSDELLARFGEPLAPVRRRLEAGPLAAVEWLLRLAPGEAQALSEAAVATARDLLASDGADGRFGREVAATVDIGATFPGDVGVVVALLLNHVVLEPGQALFLPAGNLHAYLRGVGVEVMASSDNVLRGGLTSKHIDVDGLMAIADPGTEPLPVQSPVSATHTYDSPIPDFAVTRVDSSAGAIETKHEPVGPEILLVTDGQLQVSTPTETVDLGGGAAVLLGPADRRYRLSTPNSERNGPTVAWRVTVGPPG